MIMTMTMTLAVDCLLCLKFNDKMARQRSMAKTPNSPLCAILRKIRSKILGSPERRSGIDERKNIIPAHKITGSQNLINLKIIMVKNNAKKLT